MSAKVPNIVYSKSFLAQSADLSQILITPAAAGFYRISLYAEITPLGGTITLGYTNDSGAQTIVAQGSPDGNPQDRTINAVVRLAAGQPVTLTTAMGGGFPFNLFVAIEHLD